MQFVFEFNCMGAAVRDTLGDDGDDDEFVEWVWLRNMSSASAHPQLSIRVSVQLLARAYNFGGNAVGKQGKRAFR